MNEKPQIPKVPSHPRPTDRPVPGTKDDAPPRRMQG